MSEEPEKANEVQTAADEESGASESEAADAAETTADAEGAEETAGTEAAVDEAAETERAEEEEEEDEGLQDDDFVSIAYTARTVEGDQLVDTTDEEVAEEEGVADQGTFEPRVIVLGSGHLFPAVEEDIQGKEVGDAGSVVVPAEEAFGEHDPDEVRTVSADKIPEDDRYPGAQVTIDGDQGFLETIIGGRARVDFNHPLAGEDIEYSYEILDVVDDDLERARGLLNMFLDVDLEMWIEEEEIEEERVEYPDKDELDEDEEPEPETITETVEKTTLYVEATPQLTMNQQWMFQKQQIAQEIVDKTGVDRIVVQEILDGMGGMGGLGGMMGGMGGGAPGGGDLEAALEEADVDADELVEEIEAGDGE